ncbi:MAG: hypothetical protein U5L96_00965 [Owenweeksia sp.]|nr:hypothetical protein [Owenweeksia sp.]
MMINKLSRLSLAIFSVSLIALSCKKNDPEPVPMGEELSISEMVDGNITAKLNPYGRTPLAAELNYTSVNPSRIEITVLGQQPVSGNLKVFTPRKQTPRVGSLC